jgi:hypothetical protein
MYFNRPVGERRSATERCLCKKRNEQWHERENQNNLNGSYIAITSFDDILVFCLLVYSARLSEKEKGKRRENEI